MPKISVIIPTHNRLQTLPRAVFSVLNQTFKDFDIWIVDDGSTDGTSDWVQSQILTQNEAKIHYIQTQQKGVSHARNKAVRMSQGEWIAFLDSDDEWKPEKLSKQLQMAKENPDLPLIHGEEIWVRNGVQVNPMKKHQKTGGKIFKKCVPICCISPSTSLIKRTVLEEVGLFREDFPVCEDYDLWLRITKKYEVGFIEDPVITKYGGHEDQLSRLYKAMDYYRVKSLMSILETGSLDDDEKILVTDTIKKKCEILLKGYERHNNLTHFDEVQKIANQL